MFPDLIWADRLNTKQDILQYVLSANNHYLFEIKETAVCFGAVWTLL